MIRIDKTRGLMHIDIFMEKSLEEGILDIKLTKRPAFRHCKSKDCANGRRFDYRTEGFLIINALSLMKAFGYKAGFVAIHGAILIMFDSENPLATNRILDGGWRNKCPGLVLQECIDFLCHGRSPFLGLRGLRETSRFGSSNFRKKSSRNRVLYCTIRADFGFGDTRTRSSKHTKRRSGG